MRKLILISFLIWSFYSAYSQKTLDYYLPGIHNYNQEIPTPESILGYQIGHWHVSHDQLLHYMRILSDSSNRIKLQITGKTHEDRPLILLTITSEENHNNLEQIRQEHYKLSQGIGTDANISKMPVVVYQGFSIHGNEPSGSNASLLLAYHLVASQNPEIETLLKDTIILLDPSCNPDGLQRFSTWVNSHRSTNLNPDPNDREFHEIWPSGRTNHYWFDLNRDWLLLQHPESQARINTYSKWYPNILTDHHEMGTNSTFFFQPGIQSRVNPLTPRTNQELTAKIGKFHAKALDSIGSLYYTKESFDDFYYGKGSTYPDVNGGIGILFEQGSSRGHAQNSTNGILEFPFTIRNQLTTAFSTLDAAKNMRVELLKYMRDFFSESLQLSKSHKTKSIIFGSQKDPVSAFHLAEILKQHDINLYKLKEEIPKSNNIFDPATSYVIPLDQKKHRLIRSVFENLTEFDDSLFYDVSAWTFPYSFNVDYSFENNQNNLGTLITELNAPVGSVNKSSDYAYLIEPHSYYVPKLMRLLHKSKIRFKVAMKQFELSKKKYDYGTLLIPIQNQQYNSKEIFTLLEEFASKTMVTINGVDTGLGPIIDLGSYNFKTVEKPKIALLVGDGIRTYDAGEIWHLFDLRFETPITKIDVHRLPYLNLDDYSHLILPSYSGNSLNPSINKLKEFVSNGGTLIGYRTAINWLKKNDFIDVELKENELIAQNVTYEQKFTFSGTQQIGGAIFNTKVDRSHPVSFGIPKNYLSTFRNTTIFLKPDKHSYDNPILYTSDPLLSGYISEENLELLKNTSLFKVRRKGSGKVLLFTDNTNFRAFWYGTNRLLTNAIYFSNLM